jgi:hypothetical protein
MSSLRTVSYKREEVVIPNDEASANHTAEVDALLSFCKETTEEIAKDSANTYNAITSERLFTFLNHIKEFKITSLSISRENIDECIEKLSNKSDLYKTVFMAIYTQDASAKPPNFNEFTESEIRAYKIYFRSWAKLRGIYMTLIPRFIGYLKIETKGGKQNKGLHLNHKIRLAHPLIYHKKLGRKSKKHRTSKKYRKSTKRRIM